MATDNHQ